MVVAVPFACVCPKRVSMRGVVLCPQVEPRLLLSRFDAGEGEAFDGGAIKEGRAGRHWIKKHFDLVDPPSSRIQFPPFGFKRYLAFARVRYALVSDNRFSVVFAYLSGQASTPALSTMGIKRTRPPEPSTDLRT